MIPVLLLHLPLLAAAGTLYRVLDPVSANDTVTLVGALGPPGAAAAVSFCDASGACAQAPLAAPSSSTARATVPALDPASTLTATLLSASGAALLPAAVVNAPRVTWWQGEGAWPARGGADALVGRRVRLIGRSLGWAGGRCLPFSRAAAPPPVRVEAVELSSGSAVPLEVTFASCYRVEAVVPPSVQLGVPYELRLDSGLRGPGIPAGGATTVAGVWRRGRRLAARALLPQRHWCRCPLARVRHRAPVLGHGRGGGGGHCGLPRGHLLRVPELAAP